MSTRTLYRPVTHNHTEPGLEREFRQIYKILNRLGVPQVQRAAAVPQRAAAVVADAAGTFADRVGIDVSSAGTGGVGYYATFPRMETARVVAAECLLSLEAMSLLNDLSVFYLPYIEDYNVRGDTIRVFINDADFNEPSLNITLLAQALAAYGQDEAQIARDELEWGDTVSGHFRFNERTGRVIYDYNIHGHNMTRGFPGPNPTANDPSWTATGLNFAYDGVNADEARYGVSFTSNRKGDLYTNPELPHKDNDLFTAFWIADADAGAGTRWAWLLSRNSGNHPLHWGFGYIDGKPMCAVSNSAGTATTSVTAASAASAGPHLHALRYDKVNLKLYLDGVEVASTPLAIALRDGNQFNHSFKPSTAATNRYTGTVYYGYGVKYAMTDVQRQGAETTLRKIMTARGVTLP